MTVRPLIRRPLAATASLTAQQVAKAYNFSSVTGGATGEGVTVGVIELGGGFSQSDLSVYFAKLGLPVPSVTAVLVSGGVNQSDGPNGADGEVLLDIEVLGTAAPGAKQRVYFAQNTDAGFLAAIEQAAKECRVVTCSWGGPEDQWAAGTPAKFTAAFAAGRAAGVTFFCAAGDAGSGDGESGNHVDYPASDPNVIACGGTRLEVNPDGSRASETVWDDSRTSATGGGASLLYPGRLVPDIAGNADPDSGYEVYVDGGWYVIGGTSAVAPLMAGMWACILEATALADIDALKTIDANPSTCYDITSGNNGAFRAGPGRDETTGIGVPDGGRLLTVIDVPAPPVTPPVVPPVSPPSTVPGPVLTAWNSIPKNWQNEHHTGDNKKAALAVKALFAAYGLD